MPLAPDSSELLRDGYVKLASGKRPNSTGKSVSTYEFMPNPEQCPSIGKALKEQFADGKRHRHRRFADKIDRDEGRVLRVDRMEERNDKT